MQQHPLIAHADAQHGAGLVVGQSLDVTQQDDLTLARRQIVEGGLEDR